MKIVVIDDSATNLAILCGLCARIDGSICYSFTDCELAIQHLMSDDIDVIIVDYSMPKITGVELIKRMRASYRHAKTPIVMVTGSGEMAVRNRALEVGATVFLNKPVKPAEFFATVKSIARPAAA
jgi:putative two-component system response regulator